MFFLSPVPFLGSIFGAVFLGYFFAMQRRRRRCRRLAYALQANYVSEGPFRMGRIEGTCGGKPFVLVSNATVSCVIVAVHNRGIPLCLSSRFYEDFPNWEYVHTIGDHRERMLFCHYVVRNVALPMDVACRPKVERLFRDLCDQILSDPSPQMREGVVWIHERRMEFQCLGIIEDATLVTRILRYLNEIALRLRFLPVVAPSDSPNAAK